jgi:hypothetical protein
MIHNRKQPLLTACELFLYIQDPLWVNRGKEILKVEQKEQQEKRGKGRE